MRLSSIDKTLSLNGVSKGPIIPDRLRDRQPGQQENVTLLDETIATEDRDTNVISPYKLRHFLGCRTVSWRCRVGTGDDRG
jgi:hypothetical protein